MRWTLPEERPRASAERIQRFLERYGSTGFRHARELLPLLRRDDPDETRISAHDARLQEGLRSTYRIRAKIAASAAPSPLYPRFADDVRELSIQLDSATDQALCFWNIQLPSGLCFIVFELIDDGRVADCVKTANRRVQNPGFP